MDAVLLTITIIPLIISPLTAFVPPLCLMIVIIALFVGVVDSRKMNAVIFPTPNEFFYISGGLLLLIVVEVLQFDSEVFRNVPYLLGSLIAYVAGYLSVHRQSNDKISKIYILAIFVFISTYVFIRPDLNLENLEGLEFNSNYLGPLAWGAGCLLLIRHGTGVKRVFWPLFFIALCTAVTGTRSILIGVLVGSLFAFYFQNNRQRLIAFLILLIIFLLVLPVIVEISQTPWINDLVREYTGKNLETGRLTFWGLFLDNIDLRDILFGLDPNKAFTVLLRDFDKNIQGRSMHNGYFSLMARSGIFSVIILVITLLNIFRFVGRFNSKFSKIALALLIAFAVREFFEVALHANNFPIAVLFWFFSGSAMSWLQRDRFLNSVSREPEQLNY